MNRRKFIQKLGLGTAAVAAGGVAIADIQPHNWKSPATLGELGITDMGWRLNNSITSQGSEARLLQPLAKEIQSLPKGFKVHPAFTRNETWFLS